MDQGKNAQDRLPLSLQDNATISCAGLFFLAETGAPGIMSRE
jgi:hypothetical protein